MRRLLLVVMLVFGSVAQASEPYTLGADGYYYGSDGLKYTRAATQVWIPGYYYWKGCCKYWQPGYYKTSYSYTKVLTATNPGWRSELLKLAAARDQIEGKIRYATYEQSAFMESIRELGLSGNFRIEGYGQSPHIGSYGVSGNTLYSSFTNSSVTDIYGAVDRNVLFQQASAHVNNAGTLFGQAAEGFKGMVREEGDRAVRISEIVAKGQAAALALQAAGPAPSAHFRQESTQTIPSRQQSPRWLQAANKCVQCHGDTNPEGGYQVMKHWLLTPDQQIKVVQNHLLAPDQSEGFMPRLMDGSPGKRLTSDEILEFLPASARARLR